MRSGGSPCPRRVHIDQSPLSKVNTKLIRLVWKLRPQAVRVGFSSGVVSTPQFIDNIYNELQFLEPLYLAAEDIPAIQKRYTCFLSQALDDGGQRRKKGQRKIPLADRIRMNWMDAYVSGVSLGEDRRVDAPNVQMQYAVLETDAGAEIVEKLYFDRLSDFVYIELMKGLQKGFHPKCCPN